MKEKGTKKEEGRNSEGKPWQAEGAESEKEGFEKAMKLHCGVAYILCLES